MSEARPPLLQLLIADDNAEFRAGLRGLLGGISSVKVIGEAVNGEEAVQLASRLQPDVILMDLQMPEVNGIEATRRVIAASPHMGIVVLTMFDDDDSVFAAMRAGARGYLLKGALKAEVQRSIAVVAGGGAIFSPAIARRLINFFAVSSRRPDPFPELSNREREILDLIARGKGNQEIASHLYLSLKTVRNHSSNIIAKLQVTDRAQAALRARQAGLGERQ